MFQNETFSEPNKLFWCAKCDFIEYGKESEHRCKMPKFTPEMIDLVSGKIDKLPEIRGVKNNG